VALEFLGSPPTLSGALTLICEPPTEPLAGLFGFAESVRLINCTGPFFDREGDRRYRIDRSKLAYWVRSKSPSVAATEYPSVLRLVSFYDVVSLRMVAILRSRGVTLRQIRATEHWLRQTFGYRWPFATRPVWTLGHLVFVRFGEYLVEASSSGQNGMEFLSSWLRGVDIDLDFDTQDLACLWRPHTDVTIDPHVQFGEACVAGTRVTTRSILNKVRAGDTVRIVGRMHDLSTHQVENAIQWEERLAHCSSGPILPAR